MKFVLMIFIVFGITSLSMFVHEGFHLIEAIEPHSICYDFEQDSLAHVTAKNFKTSGEGFAYYFQLLFVLGCLLYITKSVRRTTWRNKL